MMNKSILVTGAAGFIGSFLCEALIENGYSIVGVDNFFRGKLENIRHLINDNFLLEELDLSLSENVGRLTAIILTHNIETVFHLAAINGTKYFYEQPHFVFEQNIKMTQNVLAAIENTSVKYIIYTSSSEVYGEPLRLPTDEEQPILLDVHSDRDSYASSKSFGDFYITLFAKQHNLSCLILRVFNLYGERMVDTTYGQVVPEFIHHLLQEDEGKQFPLLGDGSQTRSFCYIKDAVWIMRSLMAKHITGIVNVGYDEEITILELAEVMHRIEGRKLNPQFLHGHPYDHERRRPDIRYLMSLLPEIKFTPLELGLKKTIDFYKEKRIIDQQQKSQFNLRRLSTNPILRPNPDHPWETSAVFNSGTIYLENKVHFVYRAITSEGKSVLGYASSHNGITIDERLNNPIYMKNQSRFYEEMGLSFSAFSYQSGNSWCGYEDPRLTHIEDRIYMTYTAFDARRPPSVELTSIHVDDFLNRDWKWQKPFCISPLNEMHKNWVIFPEKINGKYAILHSLSPKILVEYVDCLTRPNLSIKSHYYPKSRLGTWDNWVRGVGPPPIKTKDGWLVLYHAMDNTDPNKYKLGAMLLDLADPRRILYRLSHPILEPSQPYENEGFKQGVIYACGAVVIKNRLFVYYGAADTVLCAACIDLNLFLSVMKHTRHAEL